MRGTRDPLQFDVWPVRYLHLLPVGVGSFAVAPQLENGQRCPLEEVESILDVFLSAAQGRLVGMDVVGDWSAVRVRGMFRKTLDWIEHPTLAVNASDAAATNQRLNLRLIDFLAERGCVPRCGISICA